MKRLILLVTFVLGFCVVPMLKAQDAILEEISEMNDVEVTYITQRMLQSMGANKIKIGGLNISKIAVELTSLQILTAEEKSVAKVRNKLRSINKIKGLELIMKMKEDDERTEMYGEKGANGNYRKLLLLVDEGDEIIIVYMKGSIGKNCFDEMTKRTGISTNIKRKDYQIKEIVTVKSKNKSQSKSAQEGSGKDVSLEEINKQLALINRELESIDKELVPIEAEINIINTKIKNTKVSKREKLYVERAKLYEKRNKYYIKRNDLYVKRSNLYYKRSKIAVRDIRENIMLNDIGELINSELTIHDLDGIEYFPDSVDWLKIPQSIIISKK